MGIYNIYGKIRKHWQKPKFKPEKKTKIFCNSLVNVLKQIKTDLTKCTKCFLERSHQFYKYMLHGVYI